MSRTISFGDFGEYTPGEVTYIIELLSAMVPIDECQELFLKFTTGKKSLPGQVVQQVQLKYADKIRRTKRNVPI